MSNKPLNVAERFHSMASNEYTVIFETCDYDKFDVHPMNRPVDEAWIQHWVVELQRNNLCCDHPMLVDSDHFIIDGQHRFFACKHLGLPVYYKYAEKAKISDAPIINGNSKAWSRRTFLSVWANNGNQSCKWILELLACEPWLPIAQVLNYSNANFSTVALRVSNGDLEITEEDKSRLLYVIDRVKDFKPYFQRWNSTPFFGAVGIILRDSQYDHRRMMQKMELAGNRLIPAPTAEEYIKSLSSIYNYRAKVESYHELRSNRPLRGGRKHGS